MMNPRTALIYTVLLTFNIFVAGCIENPFAQSRLPQEMPEFTKIRYSRSGGMAPAWYRIEISEGLVSVENKKIGKRDSDRWYSKIKKEEIREIYNVFVENKFDLIENEKPVGITYDAESEGVFLSGAGFSENVSHGANSPLSGNHRARFSTIVKAIQNLVSKYESTATVVKSNYAVLNYQKTKHSIVFANGKYAKLNYLEIDEIERIVADEVSKHNQKAKKMFRIEHLDKYRRQFIPVLNENGEKEVWANYFCSENENWKKEPVFVDDGGGCYFQVYINLSKSTLRDFSVNKSV